MNREFHTRTGNGGCVLSVKKIFIAGKRRVEVWSMEKEKFVPYEKLSKKEKRKLDAEKRGSWGSVNPVTRVPENSRAYKRSKAKATGRDMEL